MTLTSIAVSVIAASSSITLIDLGKILAATTIIYNIVLSVYRLTWHPLARFPGRLIDKVSIWPLIFECYYGNRHLRLFERHRKYGSVVRIGPNTLDFDTVTAQTAIHRDRNTNVRKADWYLLEPTYSGAFSVQTVIDKKEHDTRRRVLQPAFSDNALREQEPYIDENVLILLEKLGEDIKEDGWTTPRDFSEWITFWGFDFIGDLAFGSRFKLLEESTHRYLPDMLKWASHFIYYAAYLPLKPVVRFIVGTQLMLHLMGSAARDGQRFFELSERKLEERRATERASIANDKQTRKDILHRLLESRDPETGMGFTHAQLMADSALFIGAGSDGVSVTLAAAMFYLLKNPACMGKLAHEVQTSFATVDEIRSPKLQQLPYLSGVVWEALRMAPCVPSGLPREVLPGGLNVDGLHIPAGTVVGVSPYAVHHNEECFPDSFAFKPERWLESSGANVALARQALCTFSAGRFDCIGKNIAVLACKLVLAKLLYTYELRAYKGKVTGGGGPTAGNGRERADEYQLVDYAIGYRSGPVVEVRLLQAAGKKIEG